MTRLLGVIGVVALIFAGMVWAQDAGDGTCRGRGRGMGQGRGMMHRKFVDKDNDGVCNHNGAGRMRNRHHRGGCRLNRTEKCDAAQRKIVDKDGDGRCDYQHNKSNCPHAQNNTDKGKSRQRNFVDKDGDGVCDYHKTKTEKVEPKREAR